MRRPKIAISREREPCPLCYNSFTVYQALWRTNFMRRLWAAYAQQGVVMNLLIHQLIKLFHRLTIFRITAVFLTAVTLFLVGCQENSPSPQLPATTAQFTIPIAPEFAEFYQVYGGSRIFGEPVARVTTDSDSGHLIQYFTRMRLELVGASVDAQRAIDRVAIYPLGEWAYSGVVEVVAAPLPETGQERYFPETGFTVRNGFLEFYQTHYGELLFGPPISEVLDEGGKRVQYFRNARLEWHPHMRAEARVQLGPLGRAHFDNSDNIFLDNEDRRSLPAQPQPDAGVEVALVDVSVGSPILYRGELQELSVRVETVDRQPVEGARIVIEIQYGRKTQERSVGVTNSDGLWRERVDMADIPPGEKVQLRVLVYNREDKLLGEGFAAFRTWW
jgi:hypothetical protein